ncbi:MAG: prepilin-type N-terminal cleavage/methylation domain-containing protein [Bacilli bacterium]
MKKTNGFTLIELLAVIVILAIIAVIATPIILGVINSAKKNAAESSAAGFVQAVLSQEQLSELGIEGYKAVSYPLKTAAIAGIKHTGTAPTAANIVKSGATYSGCLTVNGYVYDVGATGTVKYRENQAVCAQ